MSDSQFWDKVHAAATKATWAYLATAKGAQPKVRVVHPAFEGERVWVATGRASAKAGHVDKNPKVELFYQIAADMVHLTVTGTAKFVEDLAEKKTNLERQGLRLRSLAVLAGGRGVERLRPDADNTRSRRADLAAGDDDRQEAGSLALDAQVNSPRLVPLPVREGVRG